MAQPTRAPAPTVPLPARTQLQQLLEELYCEFGKAAPSGAPLAGVSICLTYIGKEPVVGTMSSDDFPHAHPVQAAEALVRHAAAREPSAEAAALLNKAARLLEAASKLQTGAFFETHVRH